MFTLFARGAAILTIVFTAVAPAGAATVAFLGPSGWSADDTSAQSTPTRRVLQWHLAGDISTVTFVDDTGTAYADALAAIEKNFSTNKIKPSIDKDVTCQTKTAHVIEFVTGPDGHQTEINPMLVPDGAGIATITYFRSDGTSFDPAVQKSEPAFCAATP